MGEVEWTNESVLHLIEEYRKLPELWDRNHELNNVPTAKYEAWTSLTRIYGCDIADLRRKITSVLASYRREKGKVKRGERSTWFFYPHLNFLPGYLKIPHFAEANVRTEQRSPEPAQIEYAMELEAELDDDSDEVIVKQEPAEPAPAAKARPKPKNFAALKHSRRLTRKLKRMPNARVVVAPPPPPTASYTDGKLLEMLRLLKRSDISKKKDECDSFGEYIANTLRKHDDRTQSMIKQAINNILFEQEMKQYSHTYSVEIGPDVNPLENAHETLITD